MKPTILVDMDGPLADFDVHFFQRCASEGWTLDCTVEAQRHRFATDHIPNRRERDAARAMVDTPGWFRDLPVTPGAQDGLRGLAEFAEVWICTKPLEANGTCRDDKAAWLAEHFGDEWVQRLILAPDKSMVRGDVLLDDAPKPEWFGRADWWPVIFPEPWNAAVYPDLPTWDWSSDPRELALIAVAWRHDRQTRSGDTSATVRP